MVGADGVDGLVGVEGVDGLDGVFGMKANNHLLKKSKKPNVKLNHSWKRIKVSAKLVFALCSTMISLGCRQKIKKNLGHFSVWDLPKKKRFSANFFDVRYRLRLAPGPFMWPP